MSSKPLKSTRSDNRLPELLDAAARCFASRGYAGTTMRDIALAAKMLAGSVYYHFPSKEELLVAVYEKGVEQLRIAAMEAMERESEPWEMLEALCRAHLETVLRDSDYAQVLIRVLPDDIPEAADRLRELRENYERIFRDVISRIPLPPGSDRRVLRLMLIGSLNGAALWFNPQGRHSPRALAGKFIALLKETQDGGTTA